MVWFAFKTAELREAQKKFIRTKKTEDMKASVRLAKLIDHAITRLEALPTQSELF